MTKSDNIDEAQNLRKGLIIFLLLLAIISIIGYQVWQKSQTLNAQYDKIESTL